MQNECIGKGTEKNLDEVSELCWSSVGEFSKIGRTAANFNNSLTFPQRGNVKKC